MRTSPTTTGSEPRSPLRSRPDVAEAQPPKPWLAMSRSSWRSARATRSGGGAVGAVGAVGGVGAGGRRRGLGGAHACSSWLACARRALGDGVGRRAGDGGDDLLVGRLADAEDAVVAAEPQHDDPVGDGHDVGHVVADEDDAEAVLAQPLDEVEHLGGLGDAERGGRLVEHDDLGLAEERAGDRDGLALPAGQARDGDAHDGILALSCAQQPPGLLLHRHLVERPVPRRPRCRGRGWRRRRGCRTARGPGRPWRCRAAAPRRAR